MDITDIQPRAEQAGRREWLGLAALALPVLVISIDFSVLNLALPKLAVDLSPTSTEQLWILDIYGFMIAGFLVTMGTLGDRIGHRRLLLAGAAAFAGSSVLAAFAVNPAMLIAARALLGIAGATLAPSGLALVTAMFPDPAQRAGAVAAFTGCFMGGAILGPIAGGLLLAHFWWGSVFLLAVPVMVMLLIAGPILLPESRTRDAGRPDPISVVLSLAAVLPAVYGITELARDGRNPGAWVALVIGAVAGFAFVRRQRRLPDPLIDVSLFGNRIFRGAFGSSLVTGMMQGGAILMINLFLQSVLGLSALRAGLWLVPPALAMLVTIGVSPVLAQRFRPAYIIATGMVVSAIGYGTLMLVTADGGLPVLVTGFAIAMAGIGPGLALGYDLVLGAAPPDRTGAASGTMESGGQFGVAAGVAVLGSIGVAVYRNEIQLPDGLPPEAAAQAGDSVTGAAAVTPGLPSALADGVRSAADSAFTVGLHAVSAISAVAFVLLAVVAIVAFREVGPRR
ncbi:MFS transporter [Nocardia concava]|uniref:MFS transporter n=1 Tax=Nocardia concava TaxID=257281 RepID=UPI0002F4E935|nr:MFS transporter [Nocardia concava]